MTALVWKRQATLDKVRGNIEDAGVQAVASSGVQVRAVSSMDADPQTASARLHVDHFRGDDVRVPVRMAVVSVGNIELRHGLERTDQRW